MAASAAAHSTKTRDIYPDDPPCGPAGDSPVSRQCRYLPPQRWIWILSTLALSNHANAGPDTKDILRGRNTTCSDRAPGIAMGSGVLPGLHTYREEAIPIRPEDFGTNFIYILNRVAAYPPRVKGIPCKQRIMLSSQWQSHTRDSRTGSECGFVPKCVHAPARHDAPLAPVETVERQVAAAVVVVDALTRTPPAGPASCCTWRDLQTPVQTI